MEVDADIIAMEGGDVDQEKIRQVSPGQEDARVPNSALQPQLDGIAMTSKLTVSPMDEKPFPFLRLPSEIRNKIYLDPDIYETTPSELPSRGILFCNLLQPAITRVNRQIRHETLPIFYDIFLFSADLDRIPEEDPDDHDERPDSLTHVWDMLLAFSPGPSNTLQASNLRFLTYLSITIQTGVTSACGLVGVGFTMYSDSFGLESNELSEGMGVVNTAGLGWDDPEAVKAAYVEGIDSTMLCQQAKEFLKPEFYPVRCSPTDEAVEAMALLMWLIPRQCPRLTSHVLATIEGSESLHRTIWFARVNIG